MLVFCLKTGILKIGVLVGRCRFMLKNTTRKLHSTVSAIYHTLLFLFLICFNRGNHVRLVYTIVSCLCATLNSDVLIV